MSWSHISWLLDYAHIGDALAKNNLCCAIINYRLSPLIVPEGSEEHFKHPNHTEDCAAALSYLFAHAAEHCYDHNNVVIIGHSAGGFMAGLLQFDDQFRTLWQPGLKIRRFLGLQGIYDLPSILADFGDPYLKYMIAPAFGHQPQVHKEASPTFVLSSLSNSPSLPAEKCTPWTLIWSSKDELVNRRQSDEFEAALTKHGIAVKHLVLQTENDIGSHHGVTFTEGFIRYVLPIVLESFKSEPSA